MERERENKEKNCCPGKTNWRSFTNLAQNILLQGLVFREVCFVPFLTSSVFNVHVFMFVLIVGG